MRNIQPYLLLLLLLCACSPKQPAQDLFADAVVSRATADAAEQKALLREAYLTGTAQAPIVEITVKAAALIVEQTQVSMQKTTVAESWTPTSTPVPSVTPSPTFNATVTAVYNQSRAESTQTNLMLERAEMTNKAKAAIGYTTAFVILALGIALAYVLIKRLSIVEQPLAENGKPMPLVNVIDAIVLDTDRMANGVGQLSRKFIKSLPAITAERQDGVVTRAQMVDMQTRRARLPKSLLDSQSVRGLLPDPSDSDIAARFPLPSWNIIDGWDGKGIPYYTGAGLMSINIENNPHLAILGWSGAGKSRRFARPAIACALAAGNRVVIIGESTDYWIFEEHPNAKVLTVNKITEVDQAMRYAEILRGIVAETHRRDDVLTAMHQSTWTRAGMPLTYIVLDELGNALNIMDNVDRKIANQCRAWVEVLTGKGRKYGFSVMLMNQRATGMASILANTGTAIFYMPKKEEGNHTFLRGASALHEGYFLARFDRPRLAGAFHPTDEELRSFLASRPVKPVDDEDDWVDGFVIEPPTLPEESSTEQKRTQPDSVSALVASLDEKGLKILELYQAGGLSNADIEENVFGYRGGHAARRVSKLIEQYRELKNDGSTTTTTTTTKPNLPNLGAVLA